MFYQGKNECLKTMREVICNEVAFHVGQFVNKPCRSLLDISPFSLLAPGGVKVLHWTSYLKIQDSPGLSCHEKSSSIASDYNQ